MRLVVCFFERKSIMHLVIVRRQFALSVDVDVDPPVGYIFLPTGQHHVLKRFSTINNK